MASMALELYQSSWPVRLGILLLPEALVNRTLENGKQTCQHYMPSGISLEDVATEK